MGKEDRAADGPRGNGGSYHRPQPLRIYELIQSGDLETTKVGRATLVQYRSLKRLTDNEGGGEGHAGHVWQRD